jgi:ABC-type transport system involved in multi-copper enzyme maturation permease subunit
MFAAYLHTMRESINRRMALVLIGMGILMAVILILLFSVRPLANGQSMIFLGHHMLGPAELAVPAAMVQVVQITGGLWLFLAIFASTPLIVSMMEKGWVELTLTKGVSRWQVLLGAYFGGLTLYAATLAVATIPPAVWLWFKTGVGFQSLIVAILLQVFAFAALMALAALACMSRTGAALPIMLAVLVDILSPVLAFREHGLFQVITSDFWRGVINWIYRILPKDVEIVGAAQNYIQYHKLGPWWPFWSTGVFIVVTLGLTMWLLHRKSL